MCAKSIASITCGFLIKDIAHIQLDFFVKVMKSGRVFFSAIPKAKVKMPPKKNQIVEKPLLGRPGNHLKMGIVGLPNVGKSSFFNSITNSAMPSEVPFID
jgi:ribosome biogenesis GTPase A